MIAQIWLFIHTGRSVETIVLYSGPGSVRQFDVLVNERLLECCIASVGVKTNASISYNKGSFNSSSNYSVEVEIV